MAPVQRDRLVTDLAYHVTLGWIVFEDEYNRADIMVKYRRSK